MLSPYGMDITGTCLTCKLREQKAFCSLSPTALQSLEKTKYTTAYPKGALLFVEGQAPRGLFILCQGRVKLSICASDGKTLILRIAEAGEVLGLSAAVSEKPYEATAETQGICQVSFIKRDDLGRLMREHPEFALHVAEHLSDKYNTACREIRALMLSHSAAEKLAKLLVGWLINAGDTHHPARVKLTLTHEEIAQMIGTSRETVTRLFADFKKKQLIQQNGSTLVIRNRAALETLIAV